MEDSGIVSLYLSRDEAAISCTSEKYGSRLRALANRILNNPATAEECENETYLQAWNLIPPHEPRTYLFAFLGRITRHLALDECRRAQAEKRRGLICELTGEMAQCLPARDRAEDRLEAEALRQIIDSFLSGCSVEQKDVFVRRYWFFDTIPEISRRYGFSQGKVKSMLFRMRADLRARLEAEGYEI